VTNLLAPLASSASLLGDAIEGLSRPQKILPCKWFYDAQGCRLFEAICALDEYYLTRTETEILRRSARSIAARVGPGCRLVEFGSGSGLKTRLVLDHLIAPVAYVPIDIAWPALLETSRGLAEAYPHVEILPVCADYTRPLSLPTGYRRETRTIAFFPGSTIGNLTPVEAEAFLRRVATVCGPRGGLLIGVDLQKEASVLEAAYNDRQGVTAAFNVNLLARLRDELGARISPDTLVHEAAYNSTEGRIEMRLISRRDQLLRLDGREIPIRSSEAILTEYSYKYTLHGFQRLASRVGLDTVHVWTDAHHWFAVFYLEPFSWRRDDQAPLAAAA